MSREIPGYNPHDASNEEKPPVSEISSMYLDAEQRKRVTAIILEANRIQLENILQNHPWLNPMQRAQYQEELESIKNKQNEAGEG